MKDTRERILETALDLFIEQGYETTSLREIAERIGVTKPAIYYHFSSKEEILRTLIEPILAVQGQAADSLQIKPTRREWSERISTLIDWMLPHRRLFELFERNQGALESLAHSSEFYEAHIAMHRRLDEYFADEATPLEDRIRVAASIGVVMSTFSFVGGEAFSETPVEELSTLLLRVINDVLHVD
jgi:AcrR family transcriptional regulator